MWQELSSIPKDFYKIKKIFLKNKNFWKTLKNWAGEDFD